MYFLVFFSAYGDLNNGDSLNNSTEEIDLSSSTGHLIKYRLNNENHEPTTTFKS